jgi:lipid-A-disaccharide synthase
VRPSLCLVAAEASGDALGADLIDALRAADPGARLFGIGGEKMKARGVASAIDMSGLAVLGLVDGLKAFGRVKRKVREVAEEIIRNDPDAVVLIDSWGLMWRLARELKLRGARARRIKLIGPQVWATRPGRARVLAQWCDHLLCIHGFEQPFYARWGLPTTVIGNPALGRMARGDGAAFRKANGLGANEQVIGLLPGSRPSEIRRVAPTLIRAASLLCEGRPARKVVCVAAPSIAPQLQAMAAAWRFPHLLVLTEADKPDAFAAMDIALACSGTVTTELAEQGAAIVVGYKLGWVTWAIARLFLMRSRFITLLNVAAGEEAAPEFVQTRFTPARVAHAAERLLLDPKALATQRRRQKAALKEMAGPGRPAAEISAETILRLAAS